jgi:hypothetical protein
MATMARAVSAKLVRPRVKARLAITIDGTEYLLRPFEDVLYRHMMDWWHALKGPDGKIFHVYQRPWKRGIKPDEYLRCTACQSGDCCHAQALQAFGLV